MDYEVIGTEIQARELIRRCQYLDASIYSNTKPAPFIPRPWWFANSAAQFNLMLDVPSLIDARSARKQIDKFEVTLQLNGLQNKNVESGYVNLMMRMIDTNGRRLQWSITDCHKFIKRATFNTLFRVQISIEYGEFLAGRWNSARSNKLANKFNDQSSAALLAKAQTYRDKAALIANDLSDRANELLSYAENLESAAALRDDIASDNF